MKQKNSVRRKWSWNGKPVVCNVQLASEKEGHNQPATWSIRLPEEKSAWLTRLGRFYGIENSSTKWSRDHVYKSNFRDLLELRELDEKEGRDDRFFR